MNQLFIFGFFILTACSHHNNNEKAEEYMYSSARDYYYGKHCGLLQIKFWDELVRLSEGFIYRGRRLG